MATIFPPVFRVVQDPVSMTWDQGSDNVWRGCYNHCTLYNSNYIYVLGGLDFIECKSSQKMALTTGVWSSMPDMDAGRQEAAASFILSGSKIFICGGYDRLLDNAPFEIADAGEVYDISTSAWEMVGLMGTPRYRHTATLLGNGKVLICGGYDDTAPLTSCELYDPVAKAFTSAGSLPAARSRHFAFFTSDGSDDIVVVIGGVGPSFLTSIDIYDVAADSWSTSSAIPLTNGVITSAAVKLNDGKIFFVGGETNAGKTNKAYVYDPVADTLTEKSEYAWVAAGLNAVVIPSGANAGKVLVTAGVKSQGSVYAPNSGMWDPGTDEWTYTGVHYVNSAFGGVAAKGTKVYSFGGTSIQNTSNNITQVCDTNSDIPTWSRLSGMIVKKLAIMYTSNMDTSPSTINDLDGVEFGLTVGGTQFVTTITKPTPADITPASIASDILNAALSAPTPVTKLWTQNTNDSVVLVSSESIQTGPQLLPFDAFDIMELPQACIKDPAVTGSTTTYMPIFGSFLLNSGGFTNIATFPSTANILNFQVIIKYSTPHKSNFTPGTVGFVSYYFGEITDLLVTLATTEISIPPDFGNLDFVNTIAYEGYTGLIHIPASVPFASGIYGFEFSLAPPPGATGIRLLLADSNVLAEGNPVSYISPQLSIKMTAGCR